MTTKLFFKMYSRTAVRLCYCGCLLLLFAGCEKKQDNEATPGTEPDAATLSFQPTSIAAGKTDGTYSVTVTSNTTWAVVVNAAATWCAPVPVTASGNGTVNVTVAANPTLDARTAILTFAVGVQQKSLIVTQAAGDPSLTAAPPAIAATATSGSYTIAVASNTAWTAAINSAATAWCTLAPASASGEGNGTVTLALATNLAAAPRASTVTLTAGTLSHQVAVAQAAITASPASTQTWTIGSQTWSDAIQVAECNKADYDADHDDDDDEYKADCRSYTHEGHTYYYYSWPYVAVLAAALCPSPWRVPTREDFINLDIAFGGDGQDTYDPTYVTTNYVQLWGGVYGGYGNSTSVSSTGSNAYYWSSTERSNSGAYCLFFDTSDSVRPQYHDAKRYGFQIRCVK